MTAGAKSVGGTGRHRDINYANIKGKGVSNIELWHWLPAVINYALTTYWYVMPPYEINIKANLDGVNIPIPVDPENPL